MKHALVVDDEPHIARILKRILEGNDYKVDTCPNGEAALAFLHHKQPDVLITDIQMPKMTGEELCKKITTEIPDRDFLIFVTTSRTEIEHREWSREIPNLKFLEKPLSSKKLLKELKAHFSTDSKAG